CSHIASSSTSLFFAYLLLFYFSFFFFLFPPRPPRSTLFPYTTLFRSWVHLFLEARLLGGFLASVPDRLGGDRPITGMPAVAWKQPCAGLSPQAAPVSLEFVEQFWAQQNVAVFATFTALDVNHHALAVHVADFQVCQFS